MMHLIMRITQKHRDAAQALIEGKPIRTALLQAGFSQNTADQGMRSVSGPILAAMGKQRKQFMELGKITAADQQLMVRGGLVYNALTRSDKGFNSMKALGSESRVAMFTPDQVSNILVVIPPAKSNDLPSEE